MNASVFFKINQQNLLFLSENFICKPTIVNFNRASRAARQSRWVVRATSYAVRRVCAIACPLEYIHGCNKAYWVESFATEALVLRRHCPQCEVVNEKLTANRR